MEALCKDRGSYVAKWVTATTGGLRRLCGGAALPADAGRRDGVRRKPLGWARLATASRGPLHCGRFSDGAQSAEAPFPKRWFVVHYAFPA